MDATLQGTLSANFLARNSPKLVVADTRARLKVGCLILILACDVSKSLRAELQPLFLLRMSNSSVAFHELGQLNK